MLGAKSCPLTFSSMSSCNTMFPPSVREVLFIKKTKYDGPGKNPPLKKNNAPNNKDNTHAAMDYNMEEMGNDTQDVYLFKDADATNISSTSGNKEGESPSMDSQIPQFDSLLRSRLCSRSRSRSRSAEPTRPVLNSQPMLCEPNRQDRKGKKVGGPRIVGRQSRHSKSPTFALEGIN